MRRSVRKLIFVSVVCLCGRTQWSLVPGCAPGGCAEAEQQACQAARRVWQRCVQLRSHRAVLQPPSRCRRRSGAVRVRGRSC